MTDPSHRGPSPFGRLLERFHVEGGLGRLTYAAGVEIRELKPSGVEVREQKQAGGETGVAGADRKRIGGGPVEEPGPAAEIQRWEWEGGSTGRPIGGRST